MSAHTRPDSGSPSGPGKEIWTLRLWGLADPRLDIALSALTVAVLLWTRFAFLASGPWEWDETLFARGILSFDIRAHFPHPPGFPLWMALGWLVNPFVSEPLKGLQLLSSALSVLALWPLAAVARRAAPPLVATTVSVVFLLLPGVWMYAPRGFSETPSTFFVLWAMAVLVDGLEGRRATAFVALLTAAFLTRPILLPSLGLLWLAGAATVRPRRRLLPGVAIGTAATIVATAAMIAIQGSAQSFVAAFVDHATRHARGLATNVQGFSELGIVTGSGGVWVTVTFIVLAALGTVAWARRRGRRFATVWVAILLVSVAQLVWLQDRTYPRYAVPSQLAAAPLVAAGAVAVAPAATAAWSLAALGAYLAVQTYPVMVEQHATEMPAWAALRFAAQVAARDGYELVVEPGLAPFTSYLQELDRSRGRPWKLATHLAPSATILKTLPAGRYLVLTDKPQRYLPAFAGRSWVFSGESEQLDALSQGRFERAVVLENAPLPISGWTNVARDEREIDFMWGTTQSRLLLPPLPAGTAVALDIEPTRGPATLELQVGGVSSAVLSGTVGRRTVWLDPGLLQPGHTTELSFTRPEGYAVGAGGWPQALRLSGLRAAGGPWAWSGSLLAPADLTRLGGELESDDGAPPAAVELTGVHPAEHLAAGTGTWTDPSAHLLAPASPGVLRLLAWAPRPTPPQLEVWLDGRPFAGPLVVPQRPTPVELFIGEEAIGTRMDLELRSVAWTPEHPSAGVGGPLGVVLGGIEFGTMSGWSGQPWLGAVDEHSGHWSFRSDARALYAPESFAGVAATGARFAGVRGAWTRPTWTMRLPAGPGRVTLTAWAPRAVSPRLEIWMGGTRLAGPIDLPSYPTAVAVELPPSTPADRLVELTLRSLPFVPGGGDTRRLGIVVSGVAYTPAATTR
jgi:hypothetical protein